MTIIDCPECGQALDAAIISCPNCGGIWDPKFDVRTWRRVRRKSLLLWVVMVASWAVWSLPLSFGVNMAAVGVSTVAQVWLLVVALRRRGIAAPSSRPSSLGRVAAGGVIDCTWALSVAEQNLPNSFLVQLVLFLTLLFFVPAFCTWRRGQSLGMIVVGTTVLNQQGATPGFWSSALRSARSRVAHESTEVA
jgi:uncharacterized RDD family membrane protein YckC